MTRLTKSQALALTADLRALRDAGQPIAESLINTVQMVAEHANLTLLVAAGQ